jgi:hypothetical protein
MEGAFQLGDILVLDGSHCVVVGLGGQALSNEDVPEEHIAVWFGELDAEQSKIQIRTVPEEYFKKGPEPLVVH